MTVEHSPSRAATGWPSTLARISTPVAVLLDPRRADEHRADRLALEVGELELRLEGVHLAAERVAPRDDVHDAEVLAVEHDQPGARAEHRRAGGGELAQRLGEALALDAERHRRRLAARQDEPVEPVEVRRDAHLTHVGAERAQDARVRGEPALEGEDADYQPRLASSLLGSSLRASRLCIAVPSPSDARATRSGSAKCVVASTIAARARSPGPRT